MDWKECINRRIIKELLTNPINFNLRQNNRLAQTEYPSTNYTLPKINQFLLTTKPQENDYKRRMFIYNKQ